MQEIMGGVPRILLVEFPKDTVGGVPRILWSVNRAGVKSTNSRMAVNRHGVLLTFWVGDPMRTTRSIQRRCRIDRGEEGG